MKRTSHLVTGLVIAAIAGTAALAGGHSGNPAVKARKGQMQLYAFNLGILGGMAKGQVEYDAASAQLAADNLATLATMNTMQMWPPGTSVDDLGEETRALAAGWAPENMEDILAKSAAMGEAAVAMAAAAGSLDGVRGAMGEVGRACGACHKAYRVPAN